MTEEFKTLQFPNNETGQSQKVEALKEASRKGWRLISETITSETVDIGDSARNAACLCFLCGPFCTPFLMTPTTKTGTINLTFARSYDEKQAAEVDETFEDQQREEAEKIYMEELAEDEKRANASRLIDEYMARANPTYVSENLIKAIKKYLKEDRKPFAKIPKIENCTRENGFILLVSDDGELLAKYALASLVRIKDE